MSAIDLVNRVPGASEETIRAEIDGNLCRCTGYQNIVKAIRQGAAEMAAAGAAGAAGVTSDAASYRSPKEGSWARA
jgi:carbon-monoxide dehydrogenase small subunit